MTPVKELFESQFESDVLNAEGLVMIDFWATWCGPCKALGPVIEQIAAEADPALTVFKCDVDQNSGLAARFFIRSVPTVIFMKNGEEADRLVGGYDQSVYEEKIAALL